MKNAPAGAAHGNAFDLLCLGAALAVLASHAGALAGRPQPDALGLDKLGKVALCLFLALCGYLVAARWLRELRLSDCSYGAYVYAFAVPPTFVARNGERNGEHELVFAPRVACEIVVTMARAALTWQSVEKPCLAFKPRRPGAAS